MGFTSTDRALHAPVTGQGMALYGATFDAWKGGYGAVGCDLTRQQKREVVAEQMRIKCPVRNPGEPSVRDADMGLRR